MPKKIITIPIDCKKVWISKHHSSRTKNNGLIFVFIKFDELFVKMFGAALIEPPMVFQIEKPNPR